MPTGYTADLYDGKDISLRNFVLKCSRAMGAAILQRDESLDIEIEEWKLDNYHQQQVDRAKADLAAAEARTVEEWGALECETRDRNVRETRESLAKRAELRARYESMLAEVDGWVPPTSDHCGLKDFMRQQLKDSIEFDCSMSSLDAIPPLIGAEAFKAKMIAQERKSLARAEEYLAEEIARVEGQNAWVRALRDSLQVGA